ncbi:MAG: TIGR00725 family protein [Myxococcota bacterium]
MSEWNPPVPPRRPVLSVIGSASPLEPAVENLCLELGRRAIEAGFRLVTGGLTGVMTAVSKGARSAPAWREGDILGVLPSYDRSTANPFVDVSIPTGLQLGRNVIVVAMADVIIAVGGGSGTLSELALGWQLGKPIIVLESAGGWAELLGNRCLDHRHSERIQETSTPEEAIRLALSCLERTPQEPGSIGSGWRRSSA